MNVSLLDDIERLIKEYDLENVFYAIEAILIKTKPVDVEFFEVSRLFQTGP